jgi:hypothetical protein
MKLSLVFCADDAGASDVVVSEDLLQPTKLTARAREMMRGSSLRMGNGAVIFNHDEE